MESSPEIHISKNKKSIRVSKYFNSIKVESFNHKIETKKTEERIENCLVCYENKINAILMPCGHGGF